ncbi:hypothetical protein FCM35_KLT13679 [Carex littledalei]|uniref:Proline-rich protein n=1 Tax=Carex littledalei TaxID=544730 RepID=A0A833QN45_9POAL|nr:hypothetical protein FCM35_KLT13679 [Carex littledalei]
MFIAVAFVLSSNIYTVHAARNLDVTPQQTFPGMTVPKINPLPKDPVPVPELPKVDPLPKEPLPKDPLLKDPVVPTVPKDPVVPTLPKLPFGSFHFPTLPKMPGVPEPKFPGWPRIP